MKRVEIFREFLEDNNFFIDYNGENYTLVHESEAIHFTNTSDEMYNFILGYKMANEINKETIINLNEINRTNIENYEKIIQDFTGPNTD